MTTPTPLRPPSGGAGDSGAAKPQVTQKMALNAFGWFLVYAALVPPVTVILWRVATMPWGDR